MKKALALTALLLLATVTTVSVAGAQAYPPGSNQIIVDKATVGPGGSITTSAQTYQVGATVTFTLLSTPAVLGTAVANSAGVATLTATIPADTVAGAHHIQASGIGASGVTLTQQAAITVSGSTTATTAALAKTGTSSTRPLTEAGIGAVAFGGLVLLVARRRRSAAVAS